MIAFGNVPLGAVLPVFFDAFAAATGASITLTGLAVTDIEIYKGTSMTQRSSDAGYTLLDTDGIDLDGITGIHGFSIDTGDNTDAGFFVAGSFFTVVVSAVTIDGQTVNFVAATFRLLPTETVTGYPLVDAAKWLGGTIATPTVTGVPEVDVTHHLGTAVATPSVAGVPEVDVTHVGGTAQTAGDIIADTNDIQARLPAALVSGKMDASVSDIATAGLDDFFSDSRTGILHAGTAAAIAAGSITLAAGHGLPATTKDCLVYIRSATTGKGQTRVITSLSGDVASISPNWDTTPTGTITYAVFAAAPLTAAMEARLAELDAANLPTDVAAVQADTDNLQTRIPAALVSGRIDASVGAMAAGVVTAAAIATGAVDADALAADAVAELADGVWDEAIAGHLGAGSTGAALNAAGAAGDPWSTALPGAYSAGSAGKIVGDNLNATVSSRASQVSVDTIDDFVDTEVAAILAAVDTEVAAIKAKTDQLAFTGANKVDAAILAAGDFAQAAADKVWSTASRTLTAFAFSVTAGTVTDKTGYALTSGERDAIAAALLDLADAIETGLTVRQSLRLGAAADAGKTSGMDTGTGLIRNAVADTKARITATLDGVGNRTAVTTDVT